MKYCKLYISLNNYIVVVLFFSFLYLYIYMYSCMFVSALPDPTCNSEKSAYGGNKQILLLLLLFLLLVSCCSEFLEREWYASARASRENFDQRRECFRRPAVLRGC